MHEKGNGKKVFWISGAALAVVVAASSVIWAGPGDYCRIFTGAHGHWGHHNGAAMQEEDLKDFGGFFVKRFSRHVGATGEQKAAMEKELEARIPEMLDIHKRKDALRQRMITALGGDSVDKTALEEVRKEAVALVNEASGLMLETALAVTDVLSTEQRRQVLEHVKKKHGIKG